MSKITVYSKNKNGFRRAGYAFSSEKPTIIDVNDLSQEQLKALKAEPNLVVTEGASAKVSESAQNELKALKADNENLAAAQKQTAEDKAKIEAELKDALAKIKDLEKQLKDKK